MAEKASRDEIRVAVVESKLDRVQRDITDMKDDVRSIRNDVESKFVTKDEFEPIKRIVYGLVSLILVAVVGALLALVIRR